eukprot:GHVQ01028759.1.p1 GENE.GHVQ01028759.1~~GHVQ01028759.1.p1  ORF type:complete len:250 (-),score=16.79 GHVQ01028759.1:138-887(-)
MGNTTHLYISQREHSSRSSTNVPTGSEPRFLRNEPPDGLHQVCRRSRNDDRTASSLASANTCGVSHCTSPGSSSVLLASDSESTESIVQDSSTNLARHFSKHFCFENHIAHPRAPPPVHDSHSPSCYPISITHHTGEGFSPDAGSITHDDGCMQRHNIKNSTVHRSASACQFEVARVEPRFCASPLLSCTLERIRRESCGGNIGEENPKTCGGVPELRLTMSHALGEGVSDAVKCVSNSRSALLSGRVE